MPIHPKVIATTLVGAVATVIFFIAHSGSVDPITLAVAIVTIVQAVAGYLTPSPKQP